MQLPRDPVPLGADGLAGDQLLALLEQLLLGGEPQHHPAEDVRRDQQRRDEEDVADVVVARVERR